VSGKDIRVLVARRIKVCKWIKSSINSNRRHIYFEVEFNGERVSTQTVGDLYIIKARDFVQQAAVTSFNYELNMFMENYWARNFTVCAYGDSVSGRGRVRDIDTFVWRNRDVIAILEADCKSRSLPAAHTFCLEHFAVLPSLRFVILLKVFLRGQDYTRIAAVAVLYLRRPAGPAVADAVSFGTRALDAADTIPGEVARALRSLPPARSGRPVRRRNPWTPAQRPHITVPAATLFCEDDGAMPSVWLPPWEPGEGEMREGGETAPADFVLSLWPIIKDIDTFAPGDSWPMPGPGEC
jgi:hypothetical protein